VDNVDEIPASNDLNIDEFLKLPKLLKLVFMVEPIV
jgi:hypothetical protein